MFIGDLLESPEEEFASPAGEDEDDAPESLHRTLP